MITKTGLKSGKELSRIYDTFVNSTFDDLKLNTDGEYVEIVDISEWIHIAFMRCDDELRNIEIEVEVSIPKRKCGESLGDTATQIQLLQDMITSLLYIRNLLEKGFTLSVIKEDCIWIASCLVIEKPVDEIFDALVSPD